jgi:LPS export ABC transporter protein LptC
MRPAKRAARGEIRQAEVSIIRAARYLLALLAIAGCAGKQPDAATVEEDSKVDPPSAEVITRGVSMKKFDTKGKLVWEVSADRAAGELSPEGDYTEVDGVTAVIHDNGQPAFEIEAKKGHVSKSTGKLDLHGDVRARSADGRTSLACDRITWNNKDQTIHATGNVRGESNGATLGPARTADVKFKNKPKNMNASAATALVVTSLSLQGPITYKDNAGNMAVEVDSFKITRDPNADLYNFSGTGSPFSAKWLKQGITITGNALSGTFVPLAEGNRTRWDLRSGKFTGNITAKVDGERGNMDMKGLDVFTIDHLVDSKRWKFGGSGSAITVNLPDTGATITGRQFEGFASGNSTRPEWESATITGGVRAVVTQMDRKTGQSYTVTATCPRVDIDKSERSVRLSGGARAEGNHPAMGPGGAVITSPVVILRFDAEMKTVTGVELER